jgi:hypothetical protein
MKREHEDTPVPPPFKLLRVRSPIHQHYELTMRATYLNYDGHGILLDHPHGRTLAALIGLHATPNRLLEQVVDIQNLVSRYVFGPPPPDAMHRIAFSPHVSVEENLIAIAHIGAALNRPPRYYFCGACGKRAHLYASSTVAWCRCRTCANRWFNNPMNDAQLAATMWTLCDNCTNPDDCSFWHHADQ